MATFLDALERWASASGETNALLVRNHELLQERAELLRTAYTEFGAIARLSRRLTTEAAARDQEPAPPAAARSPRRR